MILEFINRFQEIKPKLLEQFSQKEPDSYEDIFRQTLKLMFDEKSRDLPDFERIHTIDDGDYQGTLVFVVASGSYQPDNYWVTRVYYGSCSACDTFQSYSDSCNPENSAPEMVTMALHMIEEMKQIF